MAAVSPADVSSLSQQMRQSWSSLMSRSPGNTGSVLYLKAYFGHDAYTVVKVERTATLREVIRVVEQKKAVGLATREIRIVTTTGEHPFTHIDQKLEEFPTVIGLIFVNESSLSHGSQTDLVRHLPALPPENKSGPPDSSLHADLRPPQPRAGRRGSVLAAPPQQQIRLAANRDFPKLVVREAAEPTSGPAGANEPGETPPPPILGPPLKFPEFVYGPASSKSNTLSKAAVKWGTLSRKFFRSGSKGLYVAEGDESEAESVSSSSEGVGVGGGVGEGGGGGGGGGGGRAAESPGAQWRRFQLSAASSADVGTQKKKGAAMIPKSSSGQSGFSISVDNFHSPKSSVSAESVEDPLKTAASAEVCAERPVSGEAKPPPVPARTTRTAGAPAGSPSGGAPAPPAVPGDAGGGLPPCSPAPASGRPDQEAASGGGGETAAPVAGPALRKRAVSASPTVGIPPVPGGSPPASAPGSPVPPAFATLKRSQFRNRGRAASDLSEIIRPPGSPSGPTSPAAGSLPDCGVGGLPAAVCWSPSGGPGPYSFTVVLPDGRTVPLKIPQTVVMEDILNYVCLSGEPPIDAEQYTFESRDPPMLIEMDRNLHFYAEKYVQKLVVTQKEKLFSTKWVTEGDTDVMVLQLTGDQWTVMAATEEKLIARMTDGELKTDFDFIDTLLLTYRSFMRPFDFLDQLVARFNAILPPDPSPEDLEYFEKTKGPTQEKVLIVFKWWLDHHSQDFAHSDALREELRAVLTEIREYPWFEERADKLLATVDEKAQEYEAFYGKIIRNQSEKKLQLEFETIVGNLSPEEFARQLCIHDFQLFQNIHAIEYLNQIWRKPGEDLGDMGSPSLEYFIARFDVESFWLATELCNERDLKTRIKILEKFILTAKQCQIHGNFFSMFALVAGLSQNSVSRLKKTFDGLKKETRAVVEELEKLTNPSRNMKCYRDCLANTKPPIVPFLPIYLKDLTFINDGNESRVFGNMINFDKLRMMARRARDITDLAKTEYKFSPMPHVQNYLRHLHVEKDVAKLKKLSMELEPNK